MKLGFIGTGNMASAIMGGIIKNQIIPANDIIGADVMEAGRERVKEQFKIQVTADNHEVINSSDIVILSVKPQFYAEVIAEIKDDVREDQIIITIAPGKTLAWLKEQFGKNVKIVRTMPNTPALVGEGMTAACPNEYMTKEEIAYVLTLLESFGRVEIIPERLMDTVVSVSGSSRLMYLCLSKLWLMQPFPVVCQELRLTSSLPRQFLEVRKWFWKPESIQVS